MPVFSSPASAKTACRDCACGASRAMAPSLRPPARSLSRAGLQRPAAHQSHLRDARLPLRLPVAGDARLRSTSTTWPPAHRRCSSSLEIPGGFDRTLYASERVHATAQRRRAGAGLAGLSQRQARARQQSALRLRLRLLWLLAAARLQLQPAEPAGSRRGDGLCAHPRRRRPGQALARRRQDARQAQHLHRLHRRRRAPDRRAATATRRAWPSRAGRPEDC